MNLYEYYHYLQQLSRQAVALLQTRFMQQNTTPPLAGQAKRSMVKKMKLVRKIFSPKPKP